MRVPAAPNFDWRRTRPAIAAVSLPLLVYVLALEASSSASRGRALFEKVWTIQEGLGPAFNAESCAACHTDVTPGQTPRFDSPLVWVSRAVADPTGGHLFQRFKVRPNGAIRSVPPPAGSALRRAPSLFGLGMLERAIATQNVATLGAGTPGRFGWKARYATLEAVVAGALAGEMGLTSPLFGGAHNRDSPQSALEVSDAQVSDLVAFVRTLAPPAPGSQTAATKRGQRLFDDIGCARCHQPELRLTPKGDSSHTVARAYTDLALHDLGEALGDGIAEGVATRTQFRTAPLWGLRRRPAAYLHDGRTDSLHAAIVAHEGEAGDVTTRYRALSARDRAYLLAFLRML